MSVRVIATKDYIESRCMKQDNGCWVWQGATASGYGRFKINRKLESAHRAMFRECNPGVCMDGLFVCHKCDNPPCCNPEHLFLGTPSENMLDCARKKRLPFQNRSPHNQKLDLSFVDVITELRNSGVTDESIAKQLGCGRATIWRFCLKHNIYRAFKAESKAGCLDRRFESFGAG